MHKCNKITKDILFTKHKNLFIKSLFQSIIIVIFFKCAYYNQKNLLIGLTMEADSCECTCSQNIFHHSCNNGCKCPDPGGDWTIPVNVSKYCNHGFVMPMKCIILTSSPNLQTIQKYFNE